MVNEFRLRDEQNERLKFILKTKVQIRERIAAQDHKDITESISYAKKIQEAVLSDHKKLERVFSNYFIYYRPKDTVSGDFYWFETKDNVSVIAVGDCTGHGVPGAFMSMLGIVLMNVIVNERGLTEPNEILAELHKEVRKTLRQYEDTSELPDGMDLGICVIEHDEKILSFAGANHSLILMQDGQQIEVKGDKYGIGGLVLGIERVFSKATLQICKGDQIYLTTDGFKDQFGGPRNKKFSSARFRTLIKEINFHSFDQQFLIIDEMFTKWKGVCPQTDDVLVLGVVI